jgi:hypothetical protein
MLSRIQNAVRYSNEDMTLDVDASHRVLQAHVSMRRSACVSMRQHMSAYVSIRQHTSAYVSIRLAVDARWRVLHVTGKHVTEAPLPHRHTHTVFVETLTQTLDTLVISLALLNF